MRRYSILVAILVVSFSTIPVSFGDDIFEVKATIFDSTLYRHGKIEKDKPGGEVVYRVNLPEKTITRTAVYNETIPKDQGGGLQSDNTTYAIIHDGLDLVTGQRLIKAFGQTALLDGYETIVIGEDFVTTSRSSGDYFAVYDYKRTDQLAEQFRMSKGK
jgi:hypothetical protein